MGILYGCAHRDAMLAHLPRLPDAMSWESDIGSGTVSRKLRDVHHTLRVAIAP
jgi:hypothetical protein